MKFIVNEKHTNERLDVFLTEMTGQTRSQLKKTILAGLVLVNGKKATVHQFLRLDDNVEIKLEEQNRQSEAKNIKHDKHSPNRDFFHKIQEAFTKLFGSILTTSRLSSDSPLVPKVIFKCDEYLVIEKPAGLLVHETESLTEHEPTLIDWLIKNFPEVKKIADPRSLIKKNAPYRPGIVHRLDKDVSGLMLIARNQSAFDYYKQQFKLHQVKKLYTALVLGQLEKDSGAINFEISRSAQGGRMAAHPAGSGKGRPALTEYAVVEKFQKATLVEITLHTGRTNQIRVHFFALGHPIVGDQVYKIKNLALKTKISLPLLHATELSFTDQSGQERTFRSELPNIFDQLLPTL